MFKKILLLSFLFSFVFGNTVQADEQENHLIILYSSGTKSYLEGCGCNVNAGGLPLRAGLVKKLRETNKNVLLLDGGDSIRASANFSDLRAETSMKALGIMKYDALTIADGELSLGVNFFQKLQEQTSVPLLSANIYKNKNPLGTPFVIKKFSGVSVGIIGLVSPLYYSPDFLNKEGLLINDPVTTMKEILPAVKKQADIIILLAHLGRKETTALIQKVSGVDVAIIGHDQGVLSQPQTLSKTILVQNSMKGKFLGILDLSLGEKGAIENYTASMVAVNESTAPPDPEVLSVIREVVEKEKDLSRTRKMEKASQQDIVQ